MKIGADVASVWENSS